MLPDFIRIQNKKNFTKDSKDYIFKYFDLKKIPRINDTP